MEYNESTGYIIETSREAYRLYSSLFYGGNLYDIMVSFRKCIELSSDDSRVDLVKLDDETMQLMKNCLDSYEKLFEDSRKLRDRFEKVRNGEVKLKDIKYFNDIHDIPRIDA